MEYMQEKIDDYLRFGVPVRLDHQPTATEEGYVVTLRRHVRG